MIGHDAPLMEDFATVQNWVFDLDNTLYPSSSDLFPQIRHKMTHYVASLLNISQEEAIGLRHKYYKDYGTTLAGLMHHHHVEPDDFLHYVHDIDYSIIEENINLRHVLMALEGKKYIFTNGSKQHAQTTLQSLGIADLFEVIFDIKMGDYIPKPERSIYEKFLQHTGIKAENTAMFEDMPQNLRIPHKFGFKTILVADKGVVHPELKLHMGDHIHYQIINLTAFLNDLL